MYTLQSTPTVVLLPPIGARAEVLLLHTPATTTETTTTKTTHATGIPRFNSRGMISSSQPSPSCVPLAPAAVFLSLPRLALSFPSRELGFSNSSFETSRINRPISLPRVRNNRHEIRRSQIRSLVDGDFAKFLSACLSTGGEKKSGWLREEKREFVPP